MMNADSHDIPDDMQLWAVELSTPDGVLRGKVAVTRGPMRLAGLVRTTCGLTDALVAHAIELEEQAGRTISCRAGCAACCRYMVPVSPAEALHLMDVIESLEPDRRRSVLEKFDEIVGVLEQHEMIAELLDPPPTDEPVLPIARRYFELQLACPLLADESCVLHTERPIACRHCNTTSPPAACSRPYEPGVAQVPMPLPLSAPLARLTAQLTGQPPGLIPLPLVPRWVAQHADLRQRTWPGLELFDRFLTQIGSPGAAGSE